MRYDDLQILDDAGLSNRLEWLSKEEARMEIYRSLMTMEQGKMLREDIKQEINHLREMYASIPPDHPACPQMLARWQGEEFRLLRAKSKLDDVGNHIALLHEERAWIEELVTSRRKARESQREASFLPSNKESE